MDYKRFIGLTLVALTLAGSCKRKEDVSHLIQLGGEVLNAKDTVLVIEQLLTPYAFATKQEALRDTISVHDSLDTFYFRAEWPEGMYYLTYREYSFPVYLAPGKTLNVNFEHSDVIQTLEYSGGLKKVNRYLAADHQAMTHLRSNLYRMYGQEVTDFDNSLDSLRKSLDTLLVKFITERPTFNESFLQSRQLRNYYLTTRLRMEYAHARDYYNDTLATLPENFHDFLEEVPLEDPRAIDVPDYIRTLQSRMQLETEAELAEGPDDLNTYMTGQLDWVDTHIKDPMLRDFLYTTTVSNYVKYNFPHQPDTFVERYFAVTADSGLRAAVEVDLEKQRSLGPGNPAPAWTARDAEGNQVSAADLAGEVLYIDVWATWCGPCLAEMPALEKLMQSFRDKPVTFVSASIDEDIRKWFTYLDENSSDALAWHAPGGWESTLAQRYQVEAIPRYIVVDARGNLVDANAPRPSDPAVYELLEQALGTPVN